MVAIMRKMIVQEVRDTLPPGTIFLDDLQAIGDFVRSSMDDKYSLTGFLYEFDGKFVVDSVEELKANRGHTKKFKMVAAHRQTSPRGETVAGDSRIFELDDSSEAYLTCPRCLRVSDGDFYRALASVFEPRKSPFRTMIQAIPPTTRGVLFGLMGLLLIVFPGTFIYASGKLLGILHPGPGIEMIGLAAACGICFLVCALLFYALSSLSPFSSIYRVNFYFEREKQLEREGWRKGLFEKIVLASISALIGIFGTLLVQFLGSGSKH